MDTYTRSSKTAVLRRLLEPKLVTFVIGRLVIGGMARAERHR